MLKRFLCIFLLFIPSIVSSGTLKGIPDKTTVFIGEEILVEVDISPGKEMTTIFNKETESVGIVDTVPGEKKGSTIIKIIALEKGMIEVPDITLTIDGRKFAVEGFFVESGNRTDEHDLMLRDIRGTVKIIEKDYFLLWLFLAIFVVAVLIYLFVKFINRRKKIQLHQPVVVSPFEAALEYIRKARKKREEGDMEAFVDLVTIGLRDYMSLKQGGCYKEMTTSEVKKSLKKDKIFSPYLNDILTLLKLGDRFKFADENLTENDYSILIEGFESIVRDIEKMEDSSETA